MATTRTWTRFNALYQRMNSGQRFLLGMGCGALAVGMIELLLKVLNG